MKNIITLLLILSITSIYSQKGIISYTATFKNAINSDDIQKYSKEKQKIIKQMINSSEDIDYTLTINKNQSLFTKIKIMDKDDNQFNITNTLAGNLFYCNVKTKKNIEPKYAFGENFLISHKSMKWNLTSETKKINNYNCKKATGTIEIERKGIKTLKKIIAWYTSDIPLNFGPKFYNGLPGLILELQEGKLTFMATKIILNPKKDILIKKPITGKLVTTKELNKIARELRDR